MKHVETNRLLKLYVLHQRYADDIHAYSLAVRHYLGVHGGVADPPDRLSTTGLNLEAERQNRRSGSRVVTQQTDPGWTLRANPHQANG